MSMSDIPDIPHSILGDLSEVDRRSCRLLGPAALITQGLMGILVISSLIYKRHRESPKRPWRIWLFDVSKQIIGQLVVHGVNVLISHVISHVSSGNACVFYFLNILVDTTIGVGVIYFILRVLTWLFSEKCGFKGFESGQYGTPPSVIYWLRQATVYVFSLLVMKLLVVALFAAWPGILKLGDWLLEFLGPSDAIQVIFTMGLFPIMMNIIQFWLIDSIVKSSQAAAVALPTVTPRSSLDADEEPLFHASLSDEEDDDDSTLPSRHDIENPRPRSTSRSRSSPCTPPDESKSLSSGSATVAGSQSATPTPKPIDIAPGAEALAMHAYPPSLASSSTSRSASTSPSSSVLSRAKSRSPRPQRRRRSPPPALALQPISPPASKPVNPAARPSISQTLSAAEGEPPIDDVLDEKDWAAWDEGGADDWADRVGEEDWTGRRMETRKEEVHNVWANQDGVAHTTS